MFPPATNRKDHNKSQAARLVGDGTALSETPVISQASNMVDISRHMDFLGPSGKTLSVSERSGLQVSLAFTPPKNLQSVAFDLLRDTSTLQHPRHIISRRTLSAHRHVIEDQLSMEPQVNPQSRIGTVFR